MTTQSQTALQFMYITDYILIERVHRYTEYIDQCTLKQHNRNAIITDNIQVLKVYSALVVNIVLKFECNCTVA